ncbi:MAG TPA: hypothetical protein VIC34_13060 [Croceibacterium sp.]|jgi:hypothetical protein
MRILRIAPALAALALGGCATLFGEHYGSEENLKLGEVGHFGTERITPINVDEDSRCPVGTKCIWAGTVRLKVDVYPNTVDHAYFVTLGQPAAVEGGTLLLEQVSPQRTSTGQIPPNHYTFTLRYTPAAGR